MLHSLCVPCENILHQFAVIFWLNDVFCLSGALCSATACNGPSAVLRCVCVGRKTSTLVEKPAEQWHEHNMGKTFSAILFVLLPTISTVTLQNDTECTNKTNPTFWHCRMWQSSDCDKMTNNLIVVPCSFWWTNNKGHTGLQQRAECVCVCVCSLMSNTKQHIVFYHYWIYCICWRIFWNVGSQTDTP